MGHQIIECGICGALVIEARNCWECDCGAKCNRDTHFTWEPPVIEWWWLDFTKVLENRQVQAQGKLKCLKTKTKGFFSPKLERYPTRQDLATKTKL